MPPAASPPLRSIIAALAIISTLIISPVAGRAAAIDLQSLYRTQTIVTGQDPARHGPGMIECFRRVLTKVSGDPRLMTDQRVDALLPRLKEFVSAIQLHDRFAGRQIRDEQGSCDRPYDLIVDFDRAKLDRALQQIGHYPWLPPRPTLGVLVAVSLRDNRFVLTSDGRHGAGMAEALQAAADRFGVSFELPSEAERGASNLDVATVASGENLAMPGTTTRPIVSGTLDWSVAAHGWIAQWRFAEPGKTYRWWIPG